VNASPRALIEQSFPPIPAAAGAARVLVEAGTTSLPPDLVDTLVLLVSELITNSVRHAQLGPNDDVGLSVELLPRIIRVVVTDWGIGFEPTPPFAASQDPLEDAADGWGLRFVDRLADRWGTRSGPPTQVWFELSLP